MILFSFYLISETEIPDISMEKIEMQLVNAKGKERIPLLSNLSAGFKEIRPQKAINYGKEALELLKTYPDQKVRAFLLNEIGMAYKTLRDYKNAREFTQSSLSIAKQIDDKPASARALNSLGKISSSLEEFDQARNYYIRSAKLFEEINDQVNLALAYNSIASTLWRRGLYTRAMKFLFKALHIYEELGNKEGIGWINNNLGVLFLELKNIDKSLEHNLKSLNIKKELNNKDGMHKTLSNIGLVYSYKKMYTRSLDYFQRALQISLELGDQSFTSTILLNIGDTYKKQKNDQLALEYYNRSMNIKESLNDRRGMSKILINKAFVNLRLGKLKEANRQAMLALEYAQQIKIKAQISEAYQILSEIYEELGDLGNALDYHKKFKVLNDEIFDENTAKEMAGLETNFQLERRQKEIALLKKDQEKQKIILVFLIIFVLLILVLAFVIYTRYRLKARVTRVLEKEIDERKQTEQKLRESEEKFRVLAEKAEVGIWIIQDQVIKYANPMSAEIFEYSLDELLGKNPLELVIEDDRPKMTEHINKRISGSSNNLSYQFRGITRTGEINHLESYGASTLFQGKPAVLESIIDITVRKKTESELIKSRKMESVGILAGGIAHDFNNLLAIIVGNISMLKLNIGTNDPRTFSFLNNVETASAQAAELAQKFITFSEGGWLVRKKVNFSDILKDTVQLSPEINNFQDDISITIAPDLEFIYGDERQLRQVMTNLLLNAHEASINNHHYIKITAKNIAIEKENPFSLKEGRYIHISVIDHGKGIPADLLEKIFDPYFSTKDSVSKKGLGLGLAICYSITKKHEGHISITSEVQKKTTVDLYLPVFEN